MRALVVTESLGDELLHLGPVVYTLTRRNAVDSLSVIEFSEYWKAVPTRLQRYAKAQGLERMFSLGLGVLDQPAESGVLVILDRLRRCTNGYDVVIVDDDWGKPGLAMITALLDEIGGFALQRATRRDSPQQQFAYSPTEFASQLEVANLHLLRCPERRNIVAREFQSLVGLVSVEPGMARRYYQQHVLWKSTQSPDENPWDLESSVYEQDRHRFELEILRALQWDSLVEVGACTGVFTRMLCATFPSREIAAVEPVEHFARLLVERVGPDVSLFQCGAESLVASYDVVLLSSCLYYMDQIPLGLIRSAKRHVVTSHKHSYEVGVVRGVLSSEGWLLQHEAEFSPRLECLSGHLVEKDGTLVSVWRR